MSHWDGIEEFVAVASSGSFTRGAQALKRSPTHVSRAVMVLEQRLETQLFYRTTRVVRLTDTGRAFLEHCQRMIQDRDEAIALVRETREPQGELRVTCSIALGERFLAPILRRFALANPRLSLTIDLTNRIVDLVGEGYDLAIRTGDLTDTRLIATRIGARALLTCASPDYLQGRTAPGDIEDLGAHDCIVGTSPTWKFSRGGQEVTYRPSGRFRCNSGQAIADACMAGMGVAQLPDFYVQRHLQSGALRTVLDDFKCDDEPIWAVYPQRRHLSPTVRASIDCIRRELPRQMRQEENPAARRPAYP